MNVRASEREELSLGQLDTAWHMLMNVPLLFLSSPTHSEK